MASDTRFLDITLQTRDVAQLASFYEMTLGLPVTSDDAHCTIRAGNSLLRFGATENGQPKYHLAFNIPENKIEAARVWLAARAELVPHFKSGATIIDWPYWNAHSVYFLDPAGNILEVIARHGLENGAPGSFGPTDFLNVSELGFVVPDPQETMDLLASAFELPIKSRLDDFGAVGDDHGLFIVSAEKRPWMPTDNQLAEPFPARAVVRHKAAVLVRLPGTSYVVAGRTE